MNFTTVDVNFTEFLDLENILPNDIVKIICLYNSDEKTVEKYRLKIFNKYVKINIQFENEISDAFLCANQKKEKILPKKTSKYWIFSDNFKIWKYKNYELKFKKNNIQKNIFYELRNNDKIIKYYYFY